MERECELVTSFDISNVRISRKKAHATNFSTGGGGTENLFIIHIVGDEILRPIWVTSYTTRKQPQKSKGEKPEYFREHKNGIKTTLNQKRVGGNQTIRGVSPSALSTCGVVHKITPGGRRAVEVRTNIPFPAREKTTQ